MHSCMNAVAPGRNIDPATVAGFGEEWNSFDQTALNQAEWQELFDRYFAIFPWERLPENAEGFDLGWVVVSFVFEHHEPLLGGGFGCG